MFDLLMKMRMVNKNDTESKRHERYSKILIP